MNIPILLLILFVTTASHCFGRSLTSEESEGMVAEIASIMSEFEKGNVEPFLENAHESVYEMSGGKENFERVTKDAVKKLEAIGLEYVESSYGEPTDVFKAAPYEICFIPRIFVLRVQGNTVKSTAFMIAARRTGDEKWKYLDGAGLQQNPQLLKRLFPNFEDEEHLPPLKQELL